MLLKKNKCPLALTFQPCLDYIFSDTSSAQSVVTSTPPQKPWSIICQPQVMTISVHTAANNSLVRGSLEDTYHCMAQRVSCIHQN